MDVPQVYIGFHNEMIRSRTTDRKKATEIAELLLECDNLPILLRASCHMIFARGRGACGILDIGHAREAYRLLEQFTYENAKVGGGVSEEEWKRQMNELYKMRRAIQERANEIREKELGRKRRNRKCYVSPSDLEEQAQAEDIDLSTIQSTARLSDPFLDEKQETVKESERSNTSSWNISPSRRNTPPYLQERASGSPETPPPPYAPHANESPLRPHRDSTSSLHLDPSSSPSAPSGPPSKPLPLPFTPSPSQRHALPAGLEIPPRTASLSPAKKTDKDEEIPEVRLSTFLQELEMQKHESSTGGMPNWV